MATVDLGLTRRGITTAQAPVGSDATTAPRQAKPVKWWAALGVAILIYQFYGWTAWASSDNFTATTLGRAEVPGWMAFMAQVWTWTMIAGMVWLVYFWLIRPMRRTGTMSIHGKLLIIWLLLYWQDPLGIWTQNWFSYNSTLFNYGSWTTVLPGWVAPVSNRLGEPFLWVAASYVLVLAPATIFGAWLMRRAKARWPGIGKFGLVMVAFGAMFTLDLIAEVIWVRFGLYSYGGAVQSVSLGAGHYYQFPIYESVFWGAAMAAFSCVVYFRNDKGETVAERRSQELRVKNKGNTFVRFLALLAIFNVIYLSYNVTMQWFALREDAWTQDHLDRPYLLQGLCGEGSEYSCGGPGIPIPRSDSVHLGPAGEYVVPDGVVVRDESRIPQ